MADVNITSHNQSGGITAHTVNSNGPSPRSPRAKKPWWKKLGLWMVAALGVAASTVAVLEYFGLNPWESEMADKPTVNITSHNQSGGITAHTVNVAPGQRRMVPQLAANLVQSVPPGSQVTIVAVMGDNEAFAFAEDIRRWMLSNGYPDVKGVDQAMYSAPQFGQSIRKNGEAYELIIGSQPR